MTFKPNEDFIFQEVKLFVEGVQVPYNSIQINQAMGALPSASINIPPFPGLMDICRYYQPKVHIFFVDPYEDEERVLFIGHITGTSYSRSRQGGSSNISFTCAHKNALMGDVLIDFNNPTEDTNIGANPTPDSANKMNSFNSQQALTVAMRGIVKESTDKVAIEEANSSIIKEDISKTNSSTDPALLGSDWMNNGYYNRFKGLPGVIMNLWNQLKLNSIGRPEDFESMRMYTHLIENGIKYFNRIGGHYFIENANDEGKLDPCPDKSTGKATDKIIVPPGLRLFVQSAVQTDIAIMVIQQAAGFSGELTDFLTLFNSLLTRIDYEILTLASPAETRLDPDKEWSDSNTEALETIIKPQMPFYYTPNCNVYYPSMYHSVSVSQEEAAIPTRIVCTSQVLPVGSNTLHKNYRAPASVREAIAKAYGEDKKITPVGANADTAATTTSLSQKEEQLAYQNSTLLSTTDGLKNRTRLGTYEWGRGVKVRRYELPFWLSVYANSSALKSEEGKEAKTKDAFEESALALLREAWNYRYGEAKAYLNPYAPESGVMPHERLLFAYADYRYTLEVAASRAGSLDGVFNPYIIPGYPMDILDPSPVNPCFHAMCAGVTHTITANSLSTSVSFVAAVTYTELSNYYLHFVNPWLQVKLKIVSYKGSTGEYTTSIVDNEDARATAEEKFYIPTLGVGAVAPDDLYDFNNGTLKPISIDTKIMQGEARETNPMLTTQGNLLLVTRAIESRTSIEKRFGIKFIDMEANNYNPNIIKYADPKLAESELLEPGASPFLTYHSLINEDEDE